MNNKKRTLTQASLFSSFQQQQQQQQQQQEPLVSKEKVQKDNDDNKKNDDGSSNKDNRTEIRNHEQQLDSIDITSTNDSTNNDDKNKNNGSSTNENTAADVIDSKIDNSTGKDFVAETESSNTDNGSSIQPSSLSVPVPVPLEVSKQQQKQYTIYCDLDGVLVDFSQGVYNLIGKRPEEFGPNQQNLLWSKINQSTNFYKTLPWTNDGEELWNYIRPFVPTILSGVPRSKNNSASIDKYFWCKNELCCEVQHYDMAGPKYTHQRIYHPETNSKKSSKNNSTTQNNKNIIKVITCWSKNKYMECKNKQYSILIDDRIDNGQQWVQERKGTFIHHTSTKNTIEQLQKILN